MKGNIMDSTIIKLDLSKEEKNLLVKASNLKDTNISDFILEASIKKAYEILSKNGLPLSKEGHLKLVEILNDNTIPTQAMIDLNNLDLLNITKE